MAIQTNPIYFHQIGSDRLSGLGVADQLMDGQAAVRWISAVKMDESVRRMYFSEMEAERRYAAAAVLVCVAFQEVVVRQNCEALNMLCD